MASCDAVHCQGQWIQARLGKISRQVSTEDHQSERMGVGKGDVVRGGETNIR